MLQISENRVVQTTGYALRFHYRDHLGSSWLSERYSTQASDQGLGSLQLGSRTLYNQGIELTDFTPYGEPLQAVQNTEDPKYTGHEYDKMTGMNYMKGRYQLASQAKLNRPDLMRDWDWLRPNTLNLYQYTSNDPMNATDPTGLFEDPTMTQGIYRMGDNPHKSSLGNLLKGSAAYFRGILRGFDHTLATVNHAPRTEETNYLIAVTMRGIMNNSQVTDVNGNPLVDNKKQPITLGSKAVDHLVKHEDEFAGRAMTGLGASVAMGSMPRGELTGAKSTSLLFLGMAGDMAHHIQKGLESAEKEGIKPESVVNGVKFYVKTNNLTVTNAMFFTYILQPAVKAVSIYASEEDPQTITTQKAAD